MARKKYNTEEERKLGIKEYYRNYSKKWKLKNPDKVKINKSNHYNKYKEYYINYNKEYNKTVGRARKLLKDYNMTIDEYNELLIKQNECCAICNRHQSEFKIKLNVDHDHNTGKVRGLLCFDCNTGLGKLQDNKEILQNAINYLK